MHDDPVGIGPPPRLDLAAVEQLRTALDDARRVLDHLVAERDERDALLVDWNGGHRVQHDRRESEARELGDELDAELRRQRGRLDQEVTRLRALRIARSGTTPRSGWTARATLPCLLGR